MRRDRPKPDRGNEDFFVTHESHEAHELERTRKRDGAGGRCLRKDRVTFTAALSDIVRELSAVAFST
jgi:hypothetical protein